MLSIGQRGVGKTVFIVGSYAELHDNNHTGDREQLWFDCRDTQSQENIEAILNYVTRTGQYPPATMKTTDLNFSFNRHGRGGTETVSYFQWSDIPGEICDIGNSEFQKMVLNSQGCCVFINADALLHDSAYLQEIENTTKQVLAIASLVYQHNLNYPLALIFTKCDLLEPDPFRQLRIEENLQQLITGLDAKKANYQKFYSAIPIISVKEVSTLRAKGAADALLWLVSELSKPQNFRSQQALGSVITQNPSESAKSIASVDKKILGLNLPPTALRYFILILVIVTSFGIGASLLFAFNPSKRGVQQAQTSQQLIKEYEQILQSEPNNFTALINLSKVYIQLEQYNKAIPLMEKLVQLQPDLVNMRLSLAHLYELAGQRNKAETVYDQILAKQKNNISAMTSKALLRIEQGDTKTAKALLERAEKIAPNSELKVQIRKLAQESIK